MDQGFADFIDANLSQSAQVRAYAEIIGQIEKETKEQDERALGSDGVAGERGQTVHVSGFVNNSGTGTKAVSDSTFSDAGLDGGSSGAGLGSGNDMVSGDEAVLESVLSQVTSLSDVIVFTFETGQHEVLSFIENELAKHSPVKSGRYMHSNVVYADGSLVEDLRNLSTTEASEYIFVNTLPYSRKVEHGESAMAPSGVYEVVANEAEQRYGGLYKIAFIDYVGTFGPMIESSKKKYSSHTQRHMNRASNRYPAISVRPPNK